MIQVVIAVIISVTISIKLTSIVCLKIYEETLDDYEEYVKKTILNEAIIKSMLAGKDKEQLLALYETTLKDIENGADK